MKKLLYWIIPILILSSCREDLDIIDVVDQPIDDPVVMVRTVISGTITGPSGDPIQNMPVQLNNYQVRTNAQGRFKFASVDLLNHKQTIVVEHPDYFRASRSFRPLAGKEIDLAIQLLERSSIGTFSAASGKDLSGEGGFEVNFGPEVIMDSGGNPYIGEVNVFAQWMDPTKEETLLEMPGDLTGIDEEGNTTGLITYGMINVELESPSGEALNLAEGQTAELVFPVPDEIIGNAPTTIPLWYFDDDLNTWIEEGEATLIGNNYVGKVSHFTPWNCDDPIDVVEITGTVFLTNLRDSKVKIKLTAQETGWEFYATSSANGSFNMFSSLNEEMLLEIFDECGELIYSEIVGPFTEDTELDLITSESTADSYFTITGTAQNCGGQIIEDAEVYIKNFDGVSLDGSFSDENGIFELEILDCTGADNYRVEIINCVDNQKYTSSNISITEDTDLGPLNTCDDLDGNYLSIFFDGEPAEQQEYYAMAYEVQIIAQEPFKMLVTITIINWMTANIVEAFLPYDQDDVLVDMTFPFNHLGFEAHGEANISIDHDMGDINSMTVRFVSDEIEVTDPLLYPGDINEVRVKVIQN